MKDQLKKARQRVNWSTCAAEWVLFEDVLREAKEEVERNGTGQAPEARANRIWEDECYEPTLFEVEGRRVTQAEAFEAWARQGYSRTQCTRWWLAGVTHVEGGAWRNVDPTWKQEKTAMLMTARGLSSPAASSATPTAVSDRSASAGRSRTKPS